MMKIREAIFYFVIQYPTYPTVSIARYSTGGRLHTVHT